MRKIPYGRQDINEEDINAVITALKDELITQGPQIEIFENKFAEYIGCKYAVAVANGTAALHLCAMALDVNEDSRVITAPITFTASANCIRYCGGSVDFVDIDEDKVVLDVEAVRKKIESHPPGTFQGIVPIDFAGYPVDLEAFRKLADEHGLWLLEDACHAPGGFFIDSKGVQQNCGNGNYADLAIFSFHPVKHIACGEGGMITTNSKELYDKLLILRTHGITRRPDLLEKNDGGWYYEMHSLGYNYRLTDFQAALGVSQLKRATKNIEIRRAIAKRYDIAFKDFAPVETITPPADNGHAYHLYVIKTERRKELYDHLRANGIYAQIHYIPVHTQPYYRNLSTEKVNCPKAESYYDQCLSLPMFPTLTLEEQEFVIVIVKKFFE